MKYLIAASVRKLAHDHGRRVAPSYLEWLDKHVALLVERHAHQLRGTRTLHRSDAAALHGEA